MKKTLTRTCSLIFLTLLLSSCFHNNTSEENTNTGAVVPPQIQEVASGALLEKTIPIGIPPSNISPVQENKSSPATTGASLPTTTIPPDLNSAPIQTSTQSLNDVNDFEKELDSIFKQVDNDTK